MSLTALPAARVNGLNVQRVHNLVAEIQANPANAMTSWKASTRWKTGAVSETRITECSVSGKRIAKDFTFRSDEPTELGGTNLHPNPQEYLLAALNACMMVGYVANAALMGITLDSVEIESKGDIDLRGFLGLDPTVPAGYDKVHYTVRIKGDGTPEQFAAIHKTVIATSPNRFNFTNPIELTSDLVVE